MRGPGKYPGSFVSGKLKKEMAKLPPRSKCNKSKFDKKYPLVLSKLCVDCKFCTFVDDFFYRNRDGNPIMFECLEKNIRFLRKQKACDKWENKGEVPK